MASPTSDEYYAIVVAALTMLVVLVACYISIQLFRFKESSVAPSRVPACGAREGFLAPMWYNPVCRSDFLRNTRKDCKGYTSGQMPSIDDGMQGGWLCPGMIGVPI